MPEMTSPSTLPLLPKYTLNIMTNFHLKNSVVMHTWVTCLDGYPWTLHTHTHTRNDLVNYLQTVLLCQKCSAFFSAVPNCTRPHMLLDLRTFWFVSIPSSSVHVVNCTRPYTLLDLRTLFSVVCKQSSSLDGNGVHSSVKSPALDIPRTLLYL